jgi:hypothetical protein
MRRFAIAMGVAATLAIPLTGLAVGSASAAPAKPTVKAPSCAKLTGTISSTVTYSKCTPKNKKDKSAGGSVASLETTGTITWSPSGQTTTASFNFASGSGKCPKKDTQEDVTGTVTGGTSTYTATGQAIAQTVCVSSAGKLSLAKGTVAKF